ncbi:MAG: YceI family protein [Methylococcales bacterium]|nr:YceI family protein [Methylococcales bacterium]
MNEDSSQINFVSVKKNTVGEVHTFNGLSGSIDDNGQVRITISLDSAETRIPVRNERLKSLFFETSKFPLATAEIAVDIVKINTLTEGEIMNQVLSVNVDLHGVRAEIPVRVQVIGLRGHKLSVTVTEPVLLDVKDFDLLDGLIALKTIAKLPSISSSVPVTAQLLFVAQ